MWMSNSYIKKITKWSMNIWKVIQNSLVIREMLTESVVTIVQLLTCVWFFVTPRTAARQASLSFTVFQSLLKLMSIESMMPSNCLILCCPLLLLPSIFPNIRVFSSESALCIRWPKDWSFSFSISPSNEYSGLISFRVDWLDLLLPRDSQESYPTPQFKSVSPLELSLLYGPTLTSIHDFWKNWKCSEILLHLRQMVNMEKMQCHVLARR